MGDNFVQEAIGKGNVILSMKVGDYVVKGVLHEVLNVLSLVKNLLLLSKATTQGQKIEFKQDGCGINNSAREVLARVTQENRLYKQLCSKVPEYVQIAEYLENVNVQVAKERYKLMIWHESLVI